MFNNEKKILIFEFSNSPLKKSKIVQYILEIKETKQIDMTRKLLMIKFRGVQIKNNTNKKKK